MEIKLDELIDTIKKDGIEKATIEADEIIKNAKIEADRIIQDAKKEAEHLLKEGEINAEKLVLTGNASLKHASRDLILGVKNSLENIFKNIILKGVNSALTSDVLKNIIPIVIKNLVEKNESLTLSLNQNDYNTLIDYIKSEFNNEVANGLIIKPSKSVDAGFKLSVENGNAFYDFTDQKISELLSIYLNKNLQDIINK